VLVALPPLLLPAARAVERALGAVARVVADKLAVALPLQATPIGGGDFLVDGGGRVSVAAACAGLDGLIAVVLLAAPFCVGATGPLRRKAAVVGVALVTAWTLNIVRIVALLALAGHGQGTAFDVVHTWSGLVVMVCVMAAYGLAARRLGLEWRLAGLRSRVSYTPKHVVVGGSAVLAVAAVVGLSMAAQASAGLRGVTVRQVVHVAQEELPDGSRRLALEVPGHDVRRDRSFSWFRRFFGPGSQAGSFTLAAEGAPPVWAQVITSRSRRKLEQYAPLNCFIAHGATVLRVRRVALPGGAATLVDQRLRGRRFSALSWTQPVVLPDGSGGYRRVVLFADAHERAAGGGADQGLARPRSALERVAYGGLNLLSPAPDKPLRGGSFGPSGRQLVDVASTIVSSGA
jgi:exosortase/archaeosortase family protein